VAGCIGSFLIKASSTTLDSCDGSCFVPLFEKEGLGEIFQIDRPSQSSFSKGEENNYLRCALQKPSTL
jgi:hypothetical protein